MSSIQSLKDKKQLILVSIISFILWIPLVFIPIVTVIVYESIFSFRYETLPWLEYSVSDFDGLKVERSDFESDGITLAGYKYSKENTDSKGLVILAHGLGGGGHNTYMPFIDEFTSNGYSVFTYDARGNDESGGRSVGGLPQGVIDLDSAIRHTKEIDEYKGLPIFLFGHSWGAYSSATVLNIHPDIKAAVIIAGFNESEDMMKYQSEKILGEGLVSVLFSYVELYEELKFGKEFTEITAIEGMKNSDAGVLIVHSKNDATVPTKYGYDAFYSEFSEFERFEFVLYDDRGHDYLFYSESAWEYREQLNADYTTYVEAHGGEYNAEIKEEFMDKYLDKSKCFEPDPELMAEIFALYEKYTRE